MAIWSRSVNWGIRQFSPRLTRHMIADGLADLEPLDRLKHVLVAMAILAEPDENGPIAELCRNANIGCRSRVSIR